MKTLFELAQANDFACAPSSGEPIYNAQDHPEHKRGVNIKNEKVHTRIYSVFGFDETKTKANCRGVDAFGIPWTEVINSNHLIPYSHERSYIKHTTNHYKPIA